MVSAGAPAVETETQSVNDNGMTGPRVNDKENYLLFISLLFTYNSFRSRPIYCVIFFIIFIYQ